MYNIICKADKTVSNLYVIHIRVNIGMLIVEDSKECFVAGCTIVAMTLVFGLKGCIRNEIFTGIY